MINSFILFAYCFCSQRKFTVKSAKHESQLESFGFTDNATFNISIATQYKSTLIIFMAEFSELKAMAFREVSFLDLCSNHKLHFSKINSSYHYNVNYVNFKGFIESKNVYYPYILNCNYSSSKYNVITDYRNKDSHIDTRDNFYPFLYIGLSFIYLFLTIICIINFCLFKSFGILIPPILGTILCSKSIIMAAYAKIWIDRCAGIKSYDYHGTILFNIAYLFHYTIFFAFPAFIIAGWCIYRDFIPFSESFINIASSLLFVVGVWSFRFIIDVKEAFISMTLVIIGFVAIFKNNIDYIVMTSKLDDIAPRNVQNLQSKIKLVFHFDAAFVSTLIILGVFLSMAVSLNFWDVILDIIFEFLLLIISLTEMVMFLYRNQYAGNENDIDDSFTFSMSHEIDDRFKFSVINEPKSSFFALMRLS